MDLSNAYERNDVKEASDIVMEIEQLIEKEKKEMEPGEEADIRGLEEAAALLKAFVSAEESEPTVEAPKIELSKAPGAIVDTEVLTGPINGLKNFLIKKSQAKEAK